MLSPAEKVTESELNAVAAAAAVGASALAGAGVTAGGASAALSAGSAGGGVRSASAGVGAAAQIDNAVIMESADIKVIELRQKIAANWAAPEWSGAAALRAVLSGAGLTGEQINAAVAAAGRKSGEDLTATTPTLSEVCEYISTNFASEFKAVCGCAVPAASAVRLYSYSNLSVSTIAADSDINDYLITSAVPAGLSASGLVAVVLSCRVRADLLKRFAAARAAARADLFSSAEAVARRALRLGVSAAVLGRYMSLKMAAVPAADDKELKRLQKNLTSCWDSCKRIEVELINAGAVGGIEIDGGFVFPASLPASASAKVRKLWAKRVRVLSSIDTLNALIARC